MPPSPGRENKLARKQPPLRRVGPRGAVSVGAEGRIGSGLWGGRKIVLTHHEGLRPTKDRVRQAAYNLLQTRVAVDGAVVFDLCCGSGAFGLEALSRGARRAYLVDLDTTTAAANVAKLGATTATVVRHDVQSWEAPEKADIIFLDPPYHGDVVRAVLGLAESLGAPGCWWVIEVAAEEEVALHGLHLMESRTYGATKVILAQQA